jgi:hypothetical protein
MTVEELAHGGRGHQAVIGLGRQFAILGVGSFDDDDQVASRLVVADALNQAAAVDVPALERSEVDGAAIPDVDRFGADLRGE